MLCILYVNAVSFLVATAGTLAERVLPERWPRRLVWAAAISLMMVLPGVYRAHHTVVLPVGGEQAGAPTPPLSGAWWAKSESYGDMVGRGWTVASSLLLAWGVGNVLLVAAVLHRARRRHAEGLGPTVVDGVPSLVTERIGPATAGVLRTCVLLPRWVLGLPATQRRYVVRHEEEHRRARDTQLLFACSVALVVVPWNLALWWSVRRLYAAVEVDCDRRVVAALGDARAYGGLLLSVAGAASQGLTLRPAFVGGAGMLERRIAALAPRPPRRAAAIAGASLLAGILLALVLLAPHPVAAAGEAPRASNAHVNHVP